MEQSLKEAAAWFRELYGLKEEDVRSYSPLTLAYIGDAVYELIIRSYLVGQGNTAVNKLHKRASSMVKAQAQAMIIHALEPVLTEDELGVYKRGRNAHSYTKAKNATVTDYRTATGFEALIGFLFLSEQYERLLTLTAEGVKALEKRQ